MKVLVAIPCMDMMHSLFVKSLLGLKRVGEMQFAFSASSLVYDSRNGLSKKAISEGFDFVLWLDSDMEFQPDLLERLMEDMKEGREYVSGLYFKRKAPVAPVIYEKVGYYHQGDEVTPCAVPLLKYPWGVFEVEGTGFGAVLMSVDALKKVVEKYGAPFSPILGFGEDLSFCMRAKEVGIKMYCDSTVQVGHVGFKTYTAQDYLYEEAGDAGESKECPADNY